MFEYPSRHSPTNGAKGCEAAPDISTYSTKGGDYVSGEQKENVEEGGEGLKRELSDIFEDSDEGGKEDGIFSVLDGQSFTNNEVLLQSSSVPVLPGYIKEEYHFQQNQNLQDEIDEQFIDELIDEEEEQEVGATTAQISLGYVPVPVPSVEYITEQEPFNKNNINPPKHHDMCEDIKANKQQDAYVSEQDNIGYELTTECTHNMREQNVSASNGYIQAEALIQQYPYTHSLQSPPSTRESDADEIHIEEVCIDIGEEEQVQEEEEEEECTVTDSADQSQPSYVQLHTCDIISDPDEDKLLAISPCSTDTVFSLTMPMTSFNHIADQSAILYKGYTPTTNSANTAGYVSDMAAATNSHHESPFVSTSSYVTDKSGDSSSCYIASNVSSGTASSGYISESGVSSHQYESLTSPTSCDTPRMSQYNSSWTGDYNITDTSVCGSVSGSNMQGSTDHLVQPHKPAELTISHMKHSSSHKHQEICLNSPLSDAGYVDSVFNDNDCCTASLDATSNDNEQSSTGYITSSDPPLTSSDHRNIGHNEISQDYIPYPTYNESTSTTSAQDVVSKLDIVPVDLHSGTALHHLPSQHDGSKMKHDLTFNSGYVDTSQQ